MLGLLAITLSAQAGPGTALVGLQEPVEAGQITATFAPLGGAPRFCFPEARLCAVDFAGPPPWDAIQALPGLRYALPDEEIPLVQAADWSDREGTGDCADLWELDLLDAASIWALADGAGSEPVAIEDSGFRLTHEELSATSAFSWDYGDNNAGVEVVTGVSVPGHGTFIAGLIAADGDNGLGRAGLAPGIQVAYQKIADRDSALYYSYAINAMAEVASGEAGGARVLSYSLASSSSYAPFEDAVAGLGLAGVLLVAAAANCSSGPGCWDADNDRYPVYPANLDGDFILSVAGTLDDDTLNPYSHYGLESVDLAAPGADLCSLDVSSDGAYTTESGTSYATPLVAAAAALVWEIHPDLGPEEVAKLLKATVEPSSDLLDKVASGGRLDVLDALQAPLPSLFAPEENVALDPQGSVTVDLESRAAAAEVSLLLVHDPSVRVTAAGAWLVVPVLPGESFEVGGETVTLDEDSAATLISGSMEAHEAGSLSIEAEALATGRTAATLRMIALGASGVVLGAPEDGEEDISGQPAVAFWFNASAAVETETGDSGQGGETGETGETGEDSAATGDSHTHPPPLGKDAGGCSCAADTSGRSGLPWLALIGLLAIRRRTR